MWLNRSDAAVMADQIERYWKHQGYYGIRTYLVRRKGIEGVQDGWEIKSNIGPDGYPPRDAEAQAA